ncbi:hypothetical protein QQZ08_005657 [Neonectria magnoliae]|uniref:Uncharacterized protein n=1 Tax=Neonectria magnoliae TaxID=2732573 RepID=A0ABR1I2X7_9HYPO
MEDYVDKATSPFPPRVYHNLPDVESQSSDRRVKFKNLHPSERHRFMRAFLDYELLCKIHHPRPNGDYGQTDSSTSQWRISWDWKTLHHYRKQRQEPWMLETLRCVHGYVCSLYGAMFARCADAWVPEHHTDLVFPDSMLFCHEAYSNDLDVIYRVHKSLAPTLAMFGFDLATSLVATVSSEGTDLERRARWFRELARMIDMHAG